MVSPRLNQKLVEGNSTTGFRLPNPNWITVSRSEEPQAGSIVNSEFRDYLNKQLEGMERVLGFGHLPEGYQNLCPYASGCKMVEHPVFFEQNCVNAGKNCYTKQLMDEQKQ